ncbi:MAG TPA: GspH/FimT family protein, partial [Cellvibrio sp.]
MKQQGITLIELIAVLSILAIAISIAAPTFSEQIKHTQTKIAMHDLLRAIESARTLAVSSNSRTILFANQKDWTQGWSLFIDKNNDGVLNNDEILQQVTAVTSKIKIEANSHVKEYISFISTGEARKAGKSNGGALQLGTFNICPTIKGKGYG